jgi:LmbE family N-acetylglucosaminyl deacetylase
MDLDILAIAAHPDDVELTCGGTVIKMVEAEYRVGILDLSAGESGTRGSAWPAVRLSLIPYPESTTSFMTNSTGMSTRRVIRLWREKEAGSLSAWRAMT